MGGYGLAPVRRSKLSTLGIILSLLVRGKPVLSNTRLAFPPGEDLLDVELGPSELMLYSESVDKVDHWTVLFPSANVG